MVNVGGVALFQCRFLLTVIKGVLGAKIELDTFSAVTSMPGSPDQSWHGDVRYNTQLSRVAAVLTGLFRPVHITWYAHACTHFHGRMDG